MIGCMLEAKVSVTAAVHLACAKSIITKLGNNFYFCYEEKMPCRLDK
ncbi:MAG: hypothetical protein ACI8WT_002616 [Clostridium sp.]|jgi:hypothetical protein